MALEINTITGTSTIEDISENFNAIRETIEAKELSLHYLNLYNLKNSVNGTFSEITTAYNLLNLNEGFLIVGVANAISWRSFSFVTGDYLVKTTSGPVKIPGPKTGYYIPSVTPDTKVLSFAYQTTPGASTISGGNIQGAAGSGYDLTISLQVNTGYPFSKVGTAQPIIQIYDGGTLIDYPYTLSFSDPNYTLTLGSAWTGKTFTVRIR